MYNYFWYEQSYTGVWMPIWSDVAPRINLDGDGLRKQSRVVTVEVTAGGVAPCLADLVAKHPVATLVGGTSGGAEYEGAEDG